MLYPALDVTGVDGDLLLAAVDDYAPTAVDERNGSFTVFFPDTIARNGASRALTAAFPLATIAPREVDDEDWARRSQQNLQPVTVGRITVQPSALSPQPSVLSPTPITVVIPPSMGFGTGHHATTRLCLAALQSIDVSGLDVLDVGTGSGILAIAARLLGARAAVGIDSDADALRAAEENLVLNHGATSVTFRRADLQAIDLPKVDVVTANLTGALLGRAAGVLMGALRPGGRLIVSGLMVSEYEAVSRAFSAMSQIGKAEEDGWLALVFGVR